MLGGFILGIALAIATRQHPGVIAGRRRRRSGIDAAAWDAAHDELVETLRDLIRIRSVNPPPARRPTASSSPRAGSRPILLDAGLDPEVVEPVPGRGSVHVRLRGDGTGGEPLLLLSHLDVVPAPAERWTHDPFGGRPRRRLRLRPRRGRHEGDGRHGARRRPAARGRGARGRPRPGPRPDPGPPARRPVHLHRRRGGGRPGRRQMGRRESAGLAARGRARSTSAAASRRRSPAGASIRSRSPRRASPPTASPSAGRGATARCRARTTPRSSPRPSSTASPVPGPTRLTPVMDRFLELAAAELPADAARILDGLSGDDPGRAEAAIAVACDPMYARALRALLRDTVSPDVVHCGHQVQRHPGRRHDRGRLPGPARHDRARDAGGSRDPAGPGARSGLRDRARSSSARRSRRPPRARCSTS